MEGITCSSFCLSDSNLTWHHDAKFLDKTSALAVMAVGTSLLDVLSRKLCPSCRRLSWWVVTQAVRRGACRHASMFDVRLVMSVFGDVNVRSVMSVSARTLGSAVIRLLLRSLGGLSFRSQNWELLGDLRVQILRNGKNWKAASLLGCCLPGRELPCSKPEQLVWGSKAGPTLVAPAPRRVEPGQPRCWAAGS